MKALRGGLVALVLVGCAGTPAPAAVFVERSQVVDAEARLDDVMERTDVEGLRIDVARAEATQDDPSPWAQARLAILWHEAALNLGFLADAPVKGYAKKSYERLTAVQERPDTPEGLRPYVAAYRASALALWAGETGDLGRLDEAFRLFAEAVARYEGVSYAPRFLRGSVAESLPWFLARGSLAYDDFSALLARSDADPGFVPPKVLSFTLWAWANSLVKSQWFLSATDRRRALDALDRAIALDPTSQGGRPKAEALRSKILGNS